LSNNVEEKPSRAVWLEKKEGTHIEGAIKRGESSARKPVQKKGFVNKGKERFLHYQRGRGGLVTGRRLSQERNPKTSRYRIKKEGKDSNSCSTCELEKTVSNREGKKEKDTRKCESCRDKPV